MPSSRPLGSLPLRRAFERFLITYRAAYSQDSLHGLSSGFWFLFVVTGWDVLGEEELGPTEVSSAPRFERRGGMS